LTVNRIFCYKFIPTKFYVYIMSNTIFINIYRYKDLKECDPSETIIYIQSTSVILDRTCVPQVNIKITDAFWEYRKHTVCILAIITHHVSTIYNQNGKREKSTGTPFQNSYYNVCECKRFIFKCYHLINMNMFLRHIVLN
jgi:hypothetical protein